MTTNINSRNFHNVTQVAQVNLQRAFKTRIKMDVARHIWKVG